MEETNMRYKLLGHSGLRVSEVALGTMTFGEDWGWGASKEESRKIFDAFVEAGGNFIDTSINYTNGTSERYVGEFIAANRDAFVVATKYSLRDRNANKHDPNAGGNQRKNMMRSVETSLRNLNTDYIDLYYLHMWDFTTPVEEVLRGFEDLISSGKILHAGFSDTPAWVISKANTLASSRGWSRLTAIQLAYSLADRAAERDLLPMAQAEDLAVTAWGILEAGILTGKHRDPQATTRFTGASEDEMAKGDAVVAVASEIGCTPAQVAIAWVRQRPYSGAPIIPILGARSEAHIIDNLSALEITLTPEQIARLDQIGRLQLGFPHDFLNSDNVHRLVFGETFDLTDNHRKV
jgi:aryl-alcohol dehydrogenase-like predicted oxidoreductase